MQDKKVLIVGGGLDGVNAALEKAEAGAQVTIIEKFPTLGAERIPRDRLIKPDDAFVNPDLNKVSNHDNIQVLTYSKIKKVSRDNEKVTAHILKQSLRVDNSKCNDCKACIKVCPVNMFDDFDESLSFRTAVDYFNPATGEYNIFKEDMPVCQQACPVNLDIRTYVGQIADGKHLDSLATIRDRLPLPGSIGRVCPHPCETACNRQYLDEPISICFLKRYVADVELNKEIEPVYETPEKKLPEKIAIIGAGPAGLTCAYHLARQGYENITIYETLPVPGGYLWVGIPEYRLPKKLLQREVDLIANMGIDIQYNKRIGKDVPFEDLKKNNDAVFIGAGCHLGLKLRVPGEDEYEGKGIVDCVTFLRDQALGNPIDTKGKLIVIGGGNAAIDSARVGWRMGFDEVYILYRRTKKEMPANSWEIDAAEHEGVIIQYLAAPVEILGKDGKVSGMKCIKMELGEPDASGRRRPVPVEGSEYVIDAETIVPALSQGANLEFLGEDHGFDINRWNTFDIDEETSSTNIQGVFAGGDVVTGPDIAIRAVAAGKKAAEGIHEYLRSRQMIYEKEKRYIIPFDDVPSPRAEMPEISVDERRGNFVEVETGFPEDISHKEAKRCLSCRRCLGCALCWAECEPEAIDFSIPDEELDLEFDDVIITKGQDNAFFTIDSRLGFGSYPDVITDIQFERMLSPTGPTDGMVVSPLNGEIPKRIAIVQSHNDENDDQLLSSLVLGVNESIIALDRTKDLEVVLLSPINEAFKDQFLSEAEKISGLRLMEGSPESVEKTKEDDPLSLKYSENGQQKEEPFDLIVILTKPKMSSELKSLSRKLEKPVE